jgi:hypothetical protein
MKKTVGILLLGLLFLFGCSDKKFDSNKWKTHKEEQFYMLNDLVNNKRLLGKTKIEIIELLDTTNIKQYNYLDSSWMFIIIVPNSLAIGKAVEVMDIKFENINVKNVTIRH